ncbi:helix-turn-helix domain-containing protein [Halomarina oriensis]|uniref:Bacterio-opsin activator n=1 Tax=Halomarina oriensis TaxID=671145 RepID=A0A6B0GM34_9EURY|nr:helix-turn-helix domain-containing protein [Halomarina oriensis]MWG33813.1 bacterio-opsin activator [Halomarina oriensis]
MIVIADISVPASQFPLGRVLEAFPEVEIELERLIPLTEGVIPLIWVRDADADAIEATLGDDPVTESVRRLTRVGQRVLYQVEWTLGVDGLVQSFIDSEAQVVIGEGTATVWDFRLQFQSRGDLETFRASCEEKDISLSLRRLYNPALPENSQSLSERQSEALMTAYRAGYFEVPREVKLSDIAAEFDISDSAFSQRIRRGSSALIAETLIPEFGRRGGRSDSIPWG